MNKRRLFIQGTIGAGVLSSLPLFARSGALDPPRTGRITLSGQLLMEHSLCANPYPGFAEATRELQRGQVVCSDLEIAIKTAASGAPTREGEFLHLAEPEVLDCVKAMGFNLLSLANNHAWDLGTKGVLATREAVTAAGFGCAGTGSDLSAATTAGHNTQYPDVALVAMAIGKIREGAAATETRAGVNEIRLTTPQELNADDVARNLASIRQAKASGKLAVVCLHNHEWGEDMALLHDWARRFAHDCVDAGADVFFSHGAPLLKGIEIYKGKPLLHGLGSLVFQSRTAIGHYRPEVWESAIVHLIFDGNTMAGLEVVPVILNEHGDDPEHHLHTRGRPRLAQGGDANRVLSRLQSLSLSLQTSVEILGDRGQVLFS